MISISVSTDIYMRIVSSVPPGIIFYPGGVIIDPNDPIDPFIPKEVRCRALPGPRKLCKHYLPLLWKEWAAHQRKRYMEFKWPI